MKDIGGKDRADCLGNGVKEVRLRWFGHINQRNVHRMPGRRKGGKLMRAFLDVKGNIKLVKEEERQLTTPCFILTVTHCE